MSSTESFAELFENSIGQMEMTPGTLVTGTVVSYDRENVIVSAGLKSEAVIPLNEFKNDDLQIGASFELALESVEDGFGETRLSRERAKRMETWQELAAACEANDTVHGVISGKVKGGFTVEIKNVRAFLPGSLVDVRPVRDSSYLEGKELEFKVIKIDQKRNNIVVSRRAVVEEESNVEREALLSNLEEGQEAKGIVKNLTDYGAFIDLGGIDGLLHITDMSWKRIKHPSELLNVGDEIDVKVLKFDRDRNRVSLGLKQMGDDPWVDIKARYPIDLRMSGKVTNITDYGCFVEIEDGIEGLVHVSEMDWTNKNIHPSKVVHLGQEVDVKVLDIDEDRRRISLGLKQCQDNPWVSFSTTHDKGQKLTGKIKSITDFGIFIGLDGGIDGLVHLSDISWEEAGEEAIRNYKKGDELETVILAIDPERERISLGIKQMTDDAFGSYSDAHPKGTIVTGVVKEVDQKGATITLSDGIEGYLRASEIGFERVEDARNVLKAEEEIEAMVTNVDRKNRSVVLSIKAKDKSLSEKAKAAAEAAAPSATLGDILKEQIGDNASE